MEQQTPEPQHEHATADGRAAFPPAQGSDASRAAAPALSAPPKRRTGALIGVSAGAAALLLCGSVAGTWATAAAIYGTVTAAQANKERSALEQTLYNQRQHHRQSQDGSPSTNAGSSPAASADQATGIVLIDTKLAYQSAAAAGTGMVLTSDGEVLTNNHVVEGATAISVTVASTGKSYDATVVGTDATDDIAVLQLSGASGLSKANIDSATDVQVGDSVTGVGNAGGTGSLTAAAGTVAALDQTITTQAEASAPSETLNGLIETDADIQAGDSGGPLYDSAGGIVGIDTAASAGGTQTAGYAIPIGAALTIAQKIENGEASDAVQLGYPAFLGVEVASLNSTGTGRGRFGTSDGTSNVGGASAATGATVSGVVDGGPAAGAGLVAGDTITAVDGTAIGSADALTAALKDYKPGQSATISWTDASGATHSATVTFAQGPAA